MLLIRLITILFLISTFVTVSAADCTKEFMAKIACAKAGDLEAYTGNAKMALLKWQKSCAKGLTSSCDRVKKYSEDQSLIYTDYNSSPILGQCVSAPLPQDRCFKESKRFISSNPKIAAKILSNLCKNDHDRACFELGNYFFNNGEYEKAEAFYLKPCQEGNAAACSLSSQSSLKLGDQKYEKAFAALRKQINDADEGSKERDFWHTILMAVPD